MKKPKIVVGIGGRLYQYHPTYPELLEKRLGELAPDNVEVLKMKKIHKNI